MKKSALNTQDKPATAMQAAIEKIRNPEERMEFERIVKAAAESVELKQLLSPDLPPGGKGTGGKGPGGKGPGRKVGKKL